MLTAMREQTLQKEDASSQAAPVIYWHRELPPLDAEPLGEHIFEATSERVPGTIAHRDELWKRCHESLMSRASRRLVQEVARLGGRYAHVLDESIDTRHDEATGETWLHGRFVYMLYRRAAAPSFSKGAPNHA